MPAVGNAQTFQKALPPPPKPVVKTAPPVDVPHGTGVLSTGRPAVARAPAAYVAPAPRTVVPDARPHGTGTLTKATPGVTQPQSAYKTGQSYAQTVLQVFKAQPVAQQRAIWQGALRNPNTAESKILLGVAKQQVAGQRLPGATIQNPAAAVGSILDQSQYTGIGENFAKDVVNLPAETLSTVATIGGDVAGGHFGKAASAFIDPYLQLVEHPVKTFISHPLDTALMVAPFAHGLTRLAGAPVKALAPESAVGRAISTERPGIALTGKLTKERPPYSPFPTVKAGQVAAEKASYTEAPTGELVPRSRFLRDKQINQGVGELVGTRERIRVVNRAETQAQRQDAIRPSVARRVGKAVKRTLAYGAKPAMIPGADVLSRIADGTIRRPDTVTEDIGKHVAQISANRPDLLDEPKALKAHDAYVKQMTDALKNKTFLKNPGPAFRAAEQYAHDYPPVQAQAAGFGHFGNMTEEQLLRRQLTHYAVTHMNARMDENLGLVQDRAIGVKTSGGTRPVPGDLPTHAQPLSNEAILNHIKGPNGTGGRIPAYTPDRPRFDAEKQARAAHHVSSERRPLPNVKKNTLYAYTHGLTEPGHSALTEQHVLMQGIVDSHRAQNAYLDTLVTQKPGGGYWSTHAAAKSEAPAGYSPISVAQRYHPQGSLDQALKDAAPATIEEEAVRRSLDLSARTQPGTKGPYGIIDNQALKALNDHQNQISPNPLLRTIRSLNNQFRTVALSTSAKHIPGVAQENLIRDIANGVGFRSWVTGRRLLSKAEQLRPEAGKDLRTSLTGGQVAGMTEAGKTYTVSDQWRGSNAYPVLKAYEAMAKAPGPRQIRTLWRAWTKFAIGGTKKILEQQHQIAGLGKAALREHGYTEAAKTAGFMGLVHRAFGLHGQMLEDAAKGAFDPAKARQLRATINQLYGKWTDLSPSGQTALMFSPFGLWWANSARFLVRMPVDQPIKTGALAAATVGTEKQRQAEGLDMFSPGALPLYEQGGIPAGGKILAQNYYSPFGVANDPLETAAGLIQPWATPAVLASVGVDWLGKPLTSPGQNTSRANEKTPNVGERIQYVLDSGLASFVPLYQKAEESLAGGATQLDVTGPNPLPPLVRGKPPATKAPGNGIAAGLAKSFFPLREYNAATGSSSSGGWGGASPSSSSGGWGGSATTSSSGWGP